jgi:NAD(P)-dependent dehydrogenase (short-subunit alcohol dehydrogenase family)
MNSEVYSASKAGVIHLTKYFAIHLASQNICVNTISPGGIDNNHPKLFKKEYAKKTPLNRMAKASEIVDAILIFVKNKNQYLTGQNLIIDGGLTSW